MPSARRRHPKTSPFVTRNIAQDCPTRALESNACARPIVRATGKRFKRVQQFPPVPRPHCLACGDAMQGRIDGASHFQNDAKGLRNDLSCIRLRHILPGAGAHMAGGMNGSTLAHSSSIRSRPHPPGSMLTTVNRTRGPGSSTACQPASGVSLLTGRHSVDSAPEKNLEEVCDRRFLTAQPLVATVR